MLSAKFYVHPVTFHSPLSCQPQDGTRNKIRIKVNRLYIYMKGCRGPQPIPADIEALVHAGPAALALNVA